MALSGPDGYVIEVAAAVTVFAVMFSVGLGIVPADFRWIASRPFLVAKSLFCVLIAVPALALLVARGLALPRMAEIGIVLMAISPGAPVALRRSLDAGGHRTFAPALQLLVALFAVVSMPFWIGVLDEVYAGHASVAFHNVAQQVFAAQLLPLSLGMITRRMRPALASHLELPATRVAAWLLVALALLVVFEVWEAMVGAGMRVALAIVIVTVLALVVGHELGGTEPGTRAAVAISSAARNPSLALLVATQNGASSETVAIVLAYLIVSAAPIAGYVQWRRRCAKRPRTGSFDGRQEARRLNRRRSSSHR